MIDRARIEEHLRQQFEDNLDEAIDRQIELEQEARREQIKNALREQFEDNLDEAVDDLSDAVDDATEEALAEAA
jgi:hypothetical protein